CFHRCEAISGRFLSAGLNVDNSVAQIQGPWGAGHVTMNDKSVVYAGDLALAKLIELVTSSDSVVLLVTVHKKHIVKVQKVEKDNVLGCTQRATRCMSEIHSRWPLT
ncbi:MAG: hypothetical protein NTU41_12765, partial [Chloroflexi bacterium]|nr:hypothetical protein [Chloroflexota bacterium]